MNKSHFKTIITLLFAIIALLGLSFSALAHSGKTDGSGGHYNRSTGEYHYHHGYSAHQHPNGVCPYEYDDNTEYGDNTEYDDSSISSDSSDNKVWNPKTKQWQSSRYTINDSDTTDNSENEKENPSFKDYVYHFIMIVLIGILLFFPAGLIVLVPIYHLINFLFKKLFGEEKAELWEDNISRFLLIVFVVLYIIVLTVVYYNNFFVS